MKILTDTGLMVLWNKIKQLVLGNRPYNPSEFSGKGYKVLEKNIQTIGGVKKNILTQVMINQPNTIYEIRYDFDLNSETIEIQEGCTLKFNGGSFRNGNLKGNNTSISAQKEIIFRDICILGKWNITDIYLNWFEVDKINDYNIIRSFCNLQNENVQNNLYVNRNIKWMPTQDYDTLFPIHNNSKLYLCNYNLQIIPNGYHGYQFVKFASSINATLIGGVLIGDVTEHDYSNTEASHEHGHGVSINGASNIVVSNVLCKNMLGDGIYIADFQQSEKYGDMQYASKNILIENCKSEYCGRNGLSLVGNTDGITIKDCEFNNTGQLNKERSNPGFGIDIEPNHRDTCSIYNLNIINTRLYNNLNNALYVLDCIDSRSWVFENINIEKNSSSENGGDFSKSEELTIAGSFDNFSIIDSVIPCINITIHSGKSIHDNNINIEKCKINKLCSIGDYKHKQYTVNINNCLFNDNLRVLSKNDNFFNIEQGHDYVFSNCNFDYKTENPSVKTLFKTLCGNIKIRKCEITSNIPFAPTEGITEITDSKITSKGFWESIVGNNLIISNNIITAINNELYKLFDLYITAKENIQIQITNNVIYDNGIGSYFNISGNTENVYVIFKDNDIKNTNIDRLQNTIKETYNKYDIFDVIQSIYKLTLEKINKNTIPAGASFFLHNKKIPIYWDGDRWVNAYGVSIELKNNGTSLERPTLESKDEGFLYYDVTLHKPIWWNGNSWIDATGSNIQ